MATPHDRFQVGDETCGFVDAETTLAAALLTAQHHERRHERDGEPIEVTVWDLMAHRGHPREWAPDGRIIAHRGGI